MSKWKFLWMGGWDHPTGCFDSHVSQLDSHFIGLPVDLVVEGVETFMVRGKAIIDLDKPGIDLVETLVYVCETRVYVCETLR